MKRHDGFGDEDFLKPMIGIASTWSEATPCNMHIDQLGIKVKQGTQQHGGAPLRFNTITISDGIDLLQDGDVITIDSDLQTITFDVAPEEIEARRCLNT